ECRCGDAGAAISGLAAPRPPPDCARLPRSHILPDLTADHDARGGSPLSSVARCPPPRRSRHESGSAWESVKQGWVNPELPGTNDRPAGRRVAGPRGVGKHEGARLLRRAVRPLTTWARLRAAKGEGKWPARGGGRPSI